MTTLSSREILEAFDKGLERSARWPQLLKALQFAPRPQRPNPRQINEALHRLGFHSVLDESKDISVRPGAFPDFAWKAIAREVTGRDDATVESVISALQRKSQAAAE